MTDPHPTPDATPHRHTPGRHSGHELSVGDPATMKSRLLSRQCDTCIFRPGNPMYLAQGRLRDIVTTAVAHQSFVICHDTLPYGPKRDTAPAICRGFHDRYTTLRLLLIADLFGFLECDPPTTP